MQPVSGGQVSYPLPFEISEFPPHVLRPSSLLHGTAIALRVSFSLFIP